MGRFQCRSFAWSLVMLVPTACEESDPPEPLVPANYETFEEVRDCRFSVEHSAVHIRIVTSSAAERTYLDGDQPFEPGALIVKLEYRDGECRDLTGFSAMRRLADGEDPEVDDWEWQRLDAERNVIDIDDMACASCHQSCDRGHDGVCADP